MLLKLGFEGDYMKRKWQQLVTLLSVAVVAMALVWVMGGLASADHGVIDFENFDTATNTDDGFFFDFIGEGSVVDGQADVDYEGGLVVSRVGGGTFDLVSIDVVSCDGDGPCKVEVTAGRRTAIILDGTGTFLIGFSSITAFTVVPAERATMVDNIVVTLGGDTDKDGVLDVDDNCVLDPNADQADADRDGVGDACDNAPSDRNPGQEDADRDGVGDVVDNCPNSDPNDTPIDSNGCDFSQQDADNDGVPNGSDNCPNSDPNDIPIDGNGCDLTQQDPQLDADNDGVPDGSDTCPNSDPNDIPIDGNGCDFSQQDADNDGVPNGSDTCPNSNPNDPNIDGNGCDIEQQDADGDGVTNRFDTCPNSDPNDKPIDGNGCDFSQGGGDADSDGISDNIDFQPNNFSSQFGDLFVRGGTTSGEIFSRGDLIVTAVEEPSPDGVKVSAAAAPDPVDGPEFAIVAFCFGAALAVLGPGNSVLFTLRQRYTHGFGRAGGRHPGGRRRHCGHRVFG